jgi:hypothetical protein
MDEDVDFSGWELPPLQDDPDREPPPERDYRGGVWIGSDLAGVRHAGTGVLDLGEYVCNDLAAVRPTVVALVELGSTDFHALSQKERVDALLVIEQHRAWLDGLQQQVLAEVAVGDTSEDRWLKEEVACALGLAPQTAGAKLKNAEQLCTRLPSTLGLLLGRISVSCRPARLSALLAAEPAHACLQKIDAAARMAPREDQRTLEQRRTQTPSRLAGQTQPERHDDLDQPPRPRVHQPSPRTLENPRRMTELQSDA